MKVLIDTHLLIWAAVSPERLSEKAREAIASPETLPLFSAASIWEIAIKSDLGRPDFTINAAVFRTNLIENGYEELAITATHAIATGSLPQIHKDPFDRMLVAQANVEGIELLTSDQKLAAYSGPIVLV